MPRRLALWGRGGMLGDLWSICTRFLPRCNIVVCTLYMQQGAVQVHWQLSSPSPVLCTFVDGDDDLVGEDVDLVCYVPDPASADQPCRIDVDCAALHSQARLEQPCILMCCAMQLSQGATSLIIDSNARVCEVHYTATGKTADLSYLCTVRGQPGTHNSKRLTVAVPGPVGMAQLTLRSLQPKSTWHVARIAAVCGAPGGTDMPASQRQHMAHLVQQLAGTMTATRPHDLSTRVHVFFAQAWTPTQRTTQCSSLPCVLLGPHTCKHPTPNPHRL